MRIALGCDEYLTIIDQLKALLSARGHEIQWYGPNAEQSLPWPEVAEQVAKAVIAGKADEGILVCWTGTGVAIAANKFSGIRAALCGDAETTRGARLWNNANILCLSARTLSEAIAEEILEQWFTTHYQSNKADDHCLKLLNQIDSNTKG